VEGRPQVPLVSKPAAAACRAERLAGTRAGPHRFIVRPAGETERETPSANAGEEVALSESNKLNCCNVADVPVVDFAVRNVSAFD
jgi:hypothetical protein